MNDYKSLLAAGLLLSLTTVTAEAALTAGTAGGQSVVYDNATNITWTGDANLLGTLESTFGYSAIVNAIIAASPTINDIANIYDTPANSGHHTVSASDFSQTYHMGEVNWFGAMAFTNYLNTINYAGSTQWVLPSTVNSSYSFAHAVTSQLAELFYTELHGTAYQAIPVSSLFTNQLANLYWSGTEFSSTLAFNFVTSTGFQDAFDKTQTGFAWAVSSGNISAAPVPGATWLFGSALLGMLGFKKRKAV